MGARWLLGGNRIIGKTANSVVVLLDKEIYFVVSEEGLRMKLREGHFQLIEKILTEVGSGLSERTSPIGNFRHFF